MIRDSRWLERLRWWNGVADLSILLEPLYWPKITHHIITRPKTTNVGETEYSDYFEQIKQYREIALDVLRRIPKAKIAEAHM